MSAFGGKADANQLATGVAFEGIDFGGWGTPSGVCPLPDRRKLIWRFLNLVPPQIQPRPRFNLKKTKRKIERSKKLASGRSYIDVRPWDEAGYREWLLGVSSRQSARSHAKSAYSHISGSLKCCVSLCWSSASAVRYSYALPREFERIFVRSGSKKSWGKVRHFRPLVLVCSCVFLRFS